MGAPLDDLPLLQYHDGLGISHSGEAVGDDKHRPAGHQAVHALLDKLLGPGVDGAGGLIQNQHRRVGHRCPGDGQQLPLALGEVVAIPGEDGVIPLGQVL